MAKKIDQLVTASKKEITVEVGDPYLFNSRIEIRNQVLLYFPLSIDKLAVKITELKEKYPEYSNLYLNSNEYTSRYGVYLYGTRLETDLEFNYRIEREKYQESRDLAEFKRLKKKLKIKD